VQLTELEAPKLPSDIFGQFRWCWFRRGGVAWSIQDCRRKGLWRRRLRQTQVDVVTTRLNRILLRKLWRTGA